MLRIGADGCDHPNGPGPVACEAAPVSDSPAEQHAGPAGGEDGGRSALAAQSRMLRNSILSLVIFFAVIVLLLLAVPGLRSAADRISDANPSWILAGVVLEVLSCLGYVVLFGLVFGRLGPGVSTRLSLSELAVNSVVSVSGLAGIALGAWVLRSKGLSVERIAKRSVLIFVLTSAVNVGAVVLIGVLMWVGLLPGSRDPLLTLLPAAVALAALFGDDRAGGASAAVRLQRSGERASGGGAERDRRRRGRSASD